MQPVYDELYISCYNMLYTSAPVVIMGGLDQDVNPRMAARYPRLYQPGRKHMWFSRKVFAESAIHGLITSLVLICMIMGKKMKCAWGVHDCGCERSIEITNRRLLNHSFQIQLLFISMRDWFMVFNRINVL